MKINNPAGTKAPLTLDELSLTAESIAKLQLPNGMIPGLRMVIVTRGTMLRRPWRLMLWVDTTTLDLPTNG